MQLESETGITIYKFKLVNSSGNMVSSFNVLFAYFIYKKIYFSSFKYNL